MQSEEEKKTLHEVTPEDVKPPELPKVRENYEETKHDPYATTKPDAAEEVHSILPKSHGHAHLAAKEPAVEHVDLGKLSGTGKSGPHDIGTEPESVEQSQSDATRTDRPANRMWER